jgi:immune inhibitor A
MKRWLLTVVTLMAVLAVTFSSVAASSGGKDNPRPGKPDNRHDPLTDKQLALKQNALEAKLNGKANGKTHEVARGQFVQLDEEGYGMVWTVLGEFSDLPHNSIPQPDRKYDNSTLWVPDFSAAYFNNMLYNGAAGVNSVHNYYLEQSSGRYTYNGQATDWVKVPGQAWTYDDDLTSPLGGNAVWYFLKDSINGWYNAQIAAGKTPDQINAYLSQFDKWDRYDYNGNGNFDEPDGYIDHFQSIHAGEGNEAGGGALGDAAIWSHSWYAFSNLAGVAGPAFNQLGGIRIGNSDYWIGKYTIQPENGGVGVFAHEYGHDLGLPDLYDTTYIGENSTAFWSIMNQGSWLSDGTQDIGSKPNHMGAWEKFELGWLNYQVAKADKKSEFKIGPAETNTKQAQGVFVVLPKKQVVTNLSDPYSGSNYYYSGAGDDLDNFMYKAYSLPGGGTISAKVKYSTELDYDYAYLVYSTDGGATWAPIQTNLSTSADPNGQNKGFGITGSSADKWVDLNANLPAGDYLLGFRYWTDANTGGFGFMADEINVTGYPTDGAETSTGWTYKPATGGFHVTTGTESKLYNNYYLAEFRQYRGYDATLKNAYNFGWATDPIYYNKVEFFPYQDGLLISYWDTSQADNNVGLHPGSGQILPVDAHPNLLMRPDGNPWRNRVQSFDSTFSLEPTDGFTLHYLGTASKIASEPAVSQFNDLKSYWNASVPTMGVNTPKTGTIIEIRSYSALDNFMQVQVRPAK